MARKKPIISPLGQWAYPGEVTIIPSSNITMKGVNYPVLGIDDLGNQQMMMPGQDYTFPGDYVTEIPQMGKGGLTQWFDEKWVDVKTGKACGRSGKDKNSRPYPACRPSKRVNETTPKTSSELSSAEKARFKREKTSGKRIDYNHKRKELGGEAGWLEQYQVGGPIDPEFMFKNKYNTELTSSEEADFSKWAAKESQKQGRDILNDIGAYDVKGFWKSGDYKNMDSDNHGTDTWKKPNHPTFSNQSKYHGADGWYGGNWTDKTGYQPSKQTLETYGPDYYNWMFKSEPGRSEYLDMSRYESGLNKPTPFVYQKGGWLKSYQDGGTEQNPERMQGVDIKRKRKNVSDSPKYQYDSKGNLLYTPEINIQPYISDNSSRDEFLVNPKLSIQNLNPTVEEFRTVAAPYYPIDNKLVADPKINLHPSNYQQSLEQEYVLPQVVGKSFGNLSLVKDDGYSPNRRWVSNLRAKDTAAKFGKDSYAYVLKTNPNNLVDYPTRNKIENNLSLNNKTFYDYLAKNNYSPDTVEHLTRKLPDQIWNRAEQMRVEMRNNPEIMSWANLHNVDLGYKEKGESDDDFAPKIPESIYAARLAKAGLPTNRPDYEYAPMETYIVQDPSKFDLAGYFPMGSIVKDAEQKVLNKKIPGKLKREYISSNSPEYFEKEAYIKDEMAKRMGIDPSAFDNGEYLIHYNKSPITEYTPGKKYGGWLDQFQTGGIRRPIYTSNPRDPRIGSYRDSLNLYNSGEDYYSRLKKSSFDSPNIGVSEEDLKKARDENYKKYPWDKLKMPVSNEKSGKKFQPVSKYNIYVSDVGNIESNRYKKPVQPYIYKKPEVSPIYTSNPNDPRLKAYQDSLYVRRLNPQTFTLGNRTRPLTPDEKIFWKDEKTGLVPNLVEYDPDRPTSGYFGHYKKPVQPYIYKKPEVVPEVVETPLPVAPIEQPVKKIGYNKPIIQQFNYMSNENKAKALQKYGSVSDIPFQGVDINQLKNGGWLDEYQVGGVRPPIYTSDLSKVRSYNDSNTLYNSYLGNLERLKKLGQPIQTNDATIKSNYTVQKDNTIKKTDTKRMIRRWDESSEGKISPLEYPVVPKISSLEDLNYDPNQQKYQTKSFPGRSNVKNIPGKILEDNMYNQYVRQWYLTQGPDKISTMRVSPDTDEVIKRNLKEPQANVFAHMDATHKHIKPIGIDKVYLDPVIQENYKALIEYRKNGTTDSSGNIVSDSGWNRVNNNINFETKTLNNNPLFIRRYAKPFQPYIYTETPVAPAPIVEPPKPSLFVSNIDRDMYTPNGGMAREYNIGVTLQDGNRKSFRTEKEFQDWKAANNLDISKAKVTEGRGYSYDYYPENKKYGGWLSKYQPGGGWAGWTPNVGKPYMRTSPAGNAGYSDNTRLVNQNTNVSAANRKAAEAAEYAKRVGSVSQGKTKSAYEKAREASSFVSQAQQRKGSADPLDYVLDAVNPAFLPFAGIDLVGNTGSAISNTAQGNFKEAGSDLLNAGLNALYLLPAAAELRGPLYAGIPKAFVNKSKAELERQAGVDWLKNWYGQPEIKQRFNQQIYNPAIADDLVMPIYKKNVLTDVIEKPKSTINLDKSGASDFASTMSKEKYAELKYGFKNDPIVSLKYGEDIPATHKKYLGVNSGFGNNMGGYTNVYPEHPEFFYNRFNPNSQWKPTVKGTSIHEGTHWLTTGNEGLAESTKAMFKEPFDLSKRISKQDKYLTKPTEIHARLNELRSQYNLGPTVTQSQVDKIIADGLKGKTTVQKRFFELLKDNKSLTNLFNTAMGISAPLAAASQLPEQKNGGWLDIYQDGGENLPELNSKIDIANFYKNPLSEKYGIYQDPTDKGYKYYLKSAEETNIPLKTFDFSGLNNIAKKINKKEIVSPEVIKYNPRIKDYTSDQDYLMESATKEFPIIPPSYEDVLSSIPKSERLNTIPKPKTLPNKQPVVNNTSVQNNFTFDSNYWSSPDIQAEIFNRQLKDNKWYGDFDKRGDNVLNRTDVKRNYDSEIFLQNLATPNSVVIDIGSALGNNNAQLAGVSVYELASNPKIKNKNIKVIATDIPSEVKGFEELKRRGNKVYPIDYAQVPETFNTPVRDILKSKNLENVKDVYLRAANSIDLLMNVQETSEHFKHISSSLKDKNVTYLYNNVILYKPAGSTKFKKLGNLNNSAFDHRAPTWKNNPNRNHYTLLPTNATGGQTGWLNKYK